MSVVVKNPADFISDVPGILVSGKDKQGIEKTFNRRF